MLDGFRVGEVVGLLAGGAGKEAKEEALVEWSWVLWRRGEKEREEAQ